MRMETKSNVQPKYDQIVFYIQGKNPQTLQLAYSPPKSKQKRRHLPHLNLFGSLSDPIPPMMSPNMFKRIAPPVPISPMNLDGQVRGLTTQPIGPIVTHTDLHPQLPLNRLLLLQVVHLCRSFPDEEAQHGALCCKFNEGKLYALIVRKRGAKGFAGVCVCDGLVDTV